MVTIHGPARTTGLRRTGRATFLFLLLLNSSSSSSSSSIYLLNFFFFLPQDQNKCSMLSISSVQNLQLLFSDISILCSSMFVGYILWRIFQ